MDLHKIFIITEKSPDQCTYVDRALFDVTCVSDPEQLPDHPDIKRDGLLVVDLTNTPLNNRDTYLHICDIAHMLGDKPVVAMLNEVNIEWKLKALENGLSDVIPLSQPTDEVTTRFLRAVYHDIANRQLKQQLDKASGAALAAMRESSNLGSNVHFLVQAHQCENLDELGQLFFQAMKNYGLNCSLQMRSAVEVKNMEVNGMARQLESDLLSQLQGAGRYFDFGRRTVVNYGSVSVLIRNMPEDEALYGLVKDNTFTLLQGLDARVRSLDQHQQLVREKVALQQLSDRIKAAMSEANDDYQAVMRGIVDVVENMAELIAGNIPSMMLNEAQEHFIENTVSDCVLQSHKVFTEGFRIDSYFTDLQHDIERVVAEVEDMASVEESSPIPADKAVQDVELF